MIQNVLKLLAVTVFGFEADGFLTTNDLHLSTVNFALILASSAIGFGYVFYDYIVKDIWGLKK